MAEGRWVEKVLSQSQKLYIVANRLQHTKVNPDKFQPLGDLALCVYPYLLIHADEHGFVEPATLFDIQRNYLTNNTWRSEKELAIVLTAYDLVGLIHWYNATLLHKKSQSICISKPVIQLINYRGYHKYLKQPKWNQWSGKIGKISSNYLQLEIIRENFADYIQLEKINPISPNLENSNELSPIGKNFNNCPPIDIVIDIEKNSDEFHSPPSSLPLKTKKVPSEFILIRSNWSKIWKELYSVEYHEPYISNKIIDHSVLGKLIRSNVPEDLYRNKIHAIFDQCKLPKGEKKRCNWHIDNISKPSIDDLGKSWKDLDTSYLDGKSASRVPQPAIWKKILSYLEGRLHSEMLDEFYQLELIESDGVFIISGLADITVLVQKYSHEFDIAFRNCVKNYKSFSIQSTPVKPKDNLNV